MWLKDDIALANPQAIVAGREFAHIHPDGSLLAPLPYKTNALWKLPKKGGENVIRGQMTGRVGMGW